MAEPYHRFVFDEEARSFVGKFEEMYAQEDKEGFDSWHQDDLSHLGKKLSLAMLHGRGFKTLLDIGCGKGAFTACLKTSDNTITAADISPTAIAKAKARHPGIDFIVADARRALESGPFDAVVLLEVLSYLPDWRDIVSLAAERASFLFIGLFVPSNPIGHVKSIDDLRLGIEAGWTVRDELVWNREHIYLLAESKRRTK